MKIAFLSLSSAIWFFLAAASSGSAFTPVSKRKNLQVSKTKLFYDIQRDPPNDNVWSILANTERWISSTLQEAQQGGNPMSRKEVSYVCETSQDPALVLANIFRKLKEARLLGESHAQDQEDLSNTSADHERVTLRQTQILVIPANDDMMSFAVFDGLINAINQARRNARDYITDVSLDRLDERMYGDGDREWSVSVNCAHLHPNFGEKTPEQELKELKEQEEAGELDLNLQEYKRRRLQARQSPYPSVVVEVRAMVPPDFSSRPPSGPVTPDPIEDVDDRQIDSELIQNLEALFSKSTLQKDGGFYDSISSHMDTFSAVTPMTLAQNWIAEHDPTFDIAACAFTTTDTPHVDEAYEFVFTNLAMQTSQFLTAVERTMEVGAQKRQYLVMPNFVTCSATSLEKFAMEVENIITTIPSIRDKVQVTCFHPEHIQDEKRCPVPVFVLQWVA